MMDDYNGWPNRETWAVAMHLDNDQGTYNMSRGWARDAAELPYPRTALADQLREFCEDEREAVHHDPRNATEWGRMMCSDVGSLWRVDWDRVAASILDELDEDGAA